MKKFNIPGKGFKELRKGRFSQFGAFYFVTTSCYNKQKLFLFKENIQIIFNSIDWFENNKFIDCHFCIIMPDHIHIVFQITGEKTLSEIMKSFKQFSSRKIKQKIDSAQPVWQNQYYDHQIRKDENLLEIIKYCWFNSVRAGLISRPSEYPHWKSKYELE